MIEWLTLSELYFSYILDKNSGWDENVSFLLRLQCAYYFSKSTKDVCNVEGTWGSNNRCPLRSIVRIFVLSLDNPIQQALSICHMGTHWAALWMWTQFEDTKEVIKIHKSTTQWPKRKRTKGEPANYNTQIKLKMEQRETQ